MGGKKHVLVSLRRGYGVGDGCQMSAVLRHLAKHKPEWIIDYQAEPGKHVAGRGIVANTLAFGEPTREHYDLWFELLLFDTWANWSDRPNTRVSSVLHDIFSMGWDADCGRYQVNVSDQSKKAARALLGSDRCVAIHYTGISSQDKKNLTHGQAAAICRVIDKRGYMPVILDWRGECPITDYHRLRAPSAWGADIEMICAVISQCKAFVGIDSGPSKCASATDTPALVTWTGHNPIPFHDPAPNTTHLARKYYKYLYPEVHNQVAVKWFEDHNNVRFFDDDPIGGKGDKAMINCVESWLEEVLPI